MSEGGSVGVVPFTMTANDSVGCLIGSTWKVALSRQYESYLQEDGSTGVFDFETKAAGTLKRPR
jgi:hypothetical protein